MTRNTLSEEQAHLSNLLTAIQRCVYFQGSSRKRIDWPLSAEQLEDSKRDVDLFESLAAINERFAKLQDALGSAMRHAALLAGESTDSFLKVLAFYEKTGVIESITHWQLYRTARNLAAHDYETDCGVIAEHFNTLNSLVPELYRDARRFMTYCRESLGIEPSDKDFVHDFDTITAQVTP